MAVCADGRYVRPEPKAERLLTLAERAARRLKLPGPETAVLTRIHRHLAAGPIVGTLATPGTTLEILSKIDGEDGAVRTALVRMLAVAWGAALTSPIAVRILDFRE